MPRVLAILLVYLVALAALVFLVLHVFPPIVHDIEGLARKLPRYVHDFENWAKQQQAVPGPEREVPHHRQAERGGSQAALASEQRCQHPGLVHGEHPRAPDCRDHGDHADVLPAARRARDGPARHRRLPQQQRERARRIADRVAEVVKAYVSVNLLLAIASGLLTWGFLQAEGFHLAVPLAVLVAFLDLIPLIGLTIGGFSVFAVLMIDGGPGDAIVWLILFLVYQQPRTALSSPCSTRAGR